MLSWWTQHCEQWKYKISNQQKVHLMFHIRMHPLFFFRCVHVLRIEAVITLQNYKMESVNVTVFIVVHWTMYNISSKLFNRMFYCWNVRPIEMPTSWWMKPTYSLWLYKLSAWMTSKNRPDSFADVHISCYICKMHKNAVFLQQHANILCRMPRILFYYFALFILSVQRKVLHGILC